MLLSFGLVEASHGKATVTSMNCLGAVFTGVVLRRISRLVASSVNTVSVAPVAYWVRFVETRPAMVNSPGRVPAALIRGVCATRRPNRRGPFPPPH